MDATEQADTEEPTEQASSDGMANTDMTSPAETAQSEPEMAPEAQTATMETQSDAGANDSSAGTAGNQIRGK